MKRVVLQRLIHLVIVLFGISILTFCLMYLSPSDPATLFLNAQGIVPTPEVLAQTQHDMGLDKPVLTQYGDWFLGMLHGDFGHSYLYNAPVAQVLSSRAPLSFLLACITLVVLVVGALGMLTVRVLYPRSAVSRAIRLLQMLSLSIPSFWVGLVLLYVCALRLHLVPSVGFMGSKSLILPVATLFLGLVGRLLGELEESVSREFSNPYVEGLRSRGFSQKRIFFRHVLKNSLASSITLLGIVFGGLLSGSVVVETVFSLPGLGFMATSAIGARDYALVQGYVLVVSTVYVLVNLVVDLFYRLIDPRVKAGAHHE